MVAATTDSIEDWATGLDYVIDQVVVVKGQAAEYNDFVYRCIADHTSFAWATDWGNGEWERIRYQGVKGETGDQGLVGDTGAAGAKGDTGAAGANGIFSAIASEAEAIAGVENTKGMTALRTAQHVDPKLLPITTQQTTDTADIATNVAAIAVNAADIAALDARVVQLETVSPKARTIGEQRLTNNAGPIDIIGEDAGAAGQGARFEMNNAGAKSARVHVEIYRKDDAETRFTTCVLLMHFLPSTNTWYIERESTTVLVGDPDGVAFDVNTSNPSPGVYVGLVDYTTDNMAGGNYELESKVTYRIDELSDTF